MVAGGGNCRCKSQILDLDTETWSNITDLNNPREYSEMVTVNGRVIILGGSQYNPYGPYPVLDTVEELDMEQRTWKTLEVKMKKPRLDFAATVMERRDLCF